MKALKEKRVSLRSLFRRSLVILSLFALVFAVGCNNTDDSTDPVDPPDPSKPTINQDYVERLEVLQHPSMYSCEGAAHNLTGLKVAVYWDKNGKKEMEILEVKDMSSDNAKKFYVLPPVVKGNGANGTNITAVSKRGDYWLYYNGVSLAQPENLYVPYVLGLANSTIEMDGTIPKVYEDLPKDQPFDVSGIKISGTYNVLTVFSGTLPTDYGRVPADLNWKATTAAEARKEAVSPNPAAWRITRPGVDKDSTVEYVWDLVNADAVASRIKTKVKTFYYVDKLEYASGNLRNFFQDEEYFNFPEVEAIDWLKEFRTASVKFNVIYYPGPGQDSPKETREIDVDEYERAMYIVGNDGKAKATVPVLGGNPSATAKSTIYSSIADGYPLVVQCYYYSPFIINGAGLGAIDPTAPWINAAEVPVSKIYVFDNVDKDRKKNTADNGNPQILYDTPTSANASQVGNVVDYIITTLVTYYDIIYTYVDPNDDTAKTTLVNAAWKGSGLIDPPTPGTGFLTEVDVGETGEIEVGIVLPPSQWTNFVEGSPPTGTPVYEGLPFNYDVLAKPGN